MADKEQAIAKAEEISKDIKNLAAGKSEFTLPEIVPGWDEIDGKVRDLIGLEFHDRIVKDGANPDIEYKGKNSNGVDLYALK
ncbi:MAG: hypothetical protein HDQ87_03905 [Clostridia bacterium]|nr:hypothetical protein [Clostridia bacterium]